MNITYQLVCSRTKKMWMAVSEKAAATWLHRLLVAGALILSILMVSIGEAQALDPGELPTNGQVIAGEADISQSGSSMTVEQQTEHMVAEWDTFNIGTDASVNFQQPGTSSVALNRIHDQNPSQIFGSLTANGQIYLLNPSGVYFGPTAQVDVGALTASTLNISNDNFLAGKYSFEKSGNAGSVINEGVIQAFKGGYVAFIAPEIRNQGTINTPSGTTVLSAGNRVSLDFTGDSLVTFTVDQGAIDAQIENKGIIQADSGTVIMTARAADELTQAVINNSGKIEAKTLENRSGRILLLSDMESGETIVGGRLDASAPDGGDGGFIETSAAKVTVQEGAVITTAAPQGFTGTWLIDPQDYTIAATGGDITGSQLSTNLGSTSVTILSADGATEGSGDIFVNDRITWSANTLTLNAHRNIEINRELFGSGSAKLALEYGQGATAWGNTASYSVNGPVNLPAGDNFSTKLGSNGTVKLFTVIKTLGSAGSTTTTDLQGITGNLSGNYALGGNIDAAATATWNPKGTDPETYAGFVPIGNNSNSFIGTFDGLGHTISGLVINRPDTDYVGLFGGTDNAAVSNVGIIGGYIAGKNIVGGLVGYNYDYSIITNSYSTGAVTGSSYVGGLVGYNYDYSDITNSYSTGAVTGSSFAGGLVGYNHRSSITNSYAAGAVAGSSYYVGGLAGAISLSTIENSYATGTVSGVDSSVGGLVGGIGDSTITTSYATGAVTGSSFAGGLVGVKSTELSTVTNSFYDSDTTGKSDSDFGIPMSTEQMMEQKNYSGWDFTDTWYMIDGNTRPFLRMEYSTNITNAHQLQLMQLDLDADYTLANNIDMGELTQASGLWNTSTGFDPIGNAWNVLFTGTFDGLGHTISGLVINRPDTDYVGLFGGTDNAAVSNVGVIGGSIEGDVFVGALAGGIGSSTITNSYATGSVSGDEHVGGLLGAIVDSSSITNSYATGAVSGDANVGGLVGTTSESSITNSYATGSVSGTGGVGGLVGGSNSSITNSYATGSVSGTDYVGGLLGYNAGGTVTNSFYSDTTGQNDTGKGDLKNTEDMKKLTTFMGESWAWDIDDTGGTGKTWRIYEGNTYPLLRSFMTAATVTVSDLTRVYNGTTTIAGVAHNWDMTIDAGKISGAPVYTAIGKDVGEHAISLTGLYSNQEGYDIIAQDGTVNITAKAITVSGVTASDKVYNADATTAINTDSAVITAGAAADDDNKYYTGDNVTLDVSGAAGAFVDKNVGTDKAVTISGFTLSGSDSGNYMVSDASNATAKITPKAITISGVTADDKVYDATAAATVDTTNATGWIAGDTISVSASGLFDNKNVGADKTVVISGFTLSGEDSGNYTITGQTVTTADITQKPLTALYTGIDKVYDALTTADVTGFSMDIFDEDTVTFNQSADFTDKNVGTDKTVNVAGIFISGTDAANYSLQNLTASTTADITPKAIAISGITASDKVYDATTDTTVYTANASGWIEGDVVSVSATGTFVNKNAGTDKTVTLTSTYTGSDLLNYTITDQATTTADIAPKAITISGITVPDKVYDATAAATVDTTNATGWIAGDTISVSASGLFANKNVGADKTVVVSGFTLSGEDSGNYTITGQTVTTANITPALLTITANNDTKIFNNLPYIGGNGVVYDGFAGNETPAVLSGGLGYGGSSQGAVLVGEYGIEPYGLESDNYEIVYYSGILNIRESVNENILASLTSRQNGTNGTGQNLKNGLSGSQFDMGPGTGSNTITGFGNLQLVTYNITDIRSATLVSKSGSSDITFGPAPGNGTVMIIGDSPSNEMDIVIESMPVFEQTGEGEPVWQNSYTLREGDQVISLTPDQEASRQQPPDITVPGQQMPYTLRLEDGTSVQFYTGITPGGYLFISAPPDTGAINQERLILMAITVLKNELHEDSSDIKGVIIHRNPQGI